MSTSPAGRRTNGDPTAHGEMVAIRKCLATLMDQIMVSSADIAAKAP